jgi:hypothetical protein
MICSNAQSLWCGKNPPCIHRCGLEESLRFKEQKQVVQLPSGKLT